MSLSSSERNPRALVALCLGLLLACSSGCGKNVGVGQPKAPKTPADGTKPAAAPAQQPKTARGVLEAMVKAYKDCKSYADAGTVRLQAAGGDQKIDQSVEFSVTMARPNKIRMHVYEGILVSDGKQLNAAVLSLPDQVLSRKAPEKLNIQDVYSDEILSASITQGFAGPSPQLVLLLVDEPLKAFLHGADEPEFAEPGKLGERDYFRVSITRPDGTSVFWIDQETFILRRIEFPTDELRRMLLDENRTLDSVSLEADFAGAKLDGKIDAKAFQFQTPEKARVVKFFVPPHPAQLLGKPVPDFTFESLDGKLVTPKSLSGRIVVMDFWASWCGPCRMSLPNLEKVYQKYKDNDKLAFVAVNVDRPDVDNKKLTTMFEDLKVTVPIVRDLQQLSIGFKITGIPTMFILGPDGLVQDYEIGGNPEVAEALAGKLDKLLAGQNIYEEPLARYEEQLKRRAELIEQGKEPAESLTDERQEIPRAEIAPASAPKTFRLEPLWKCTEMSKPGNILVVPGADGPKILVIDEWKAVAEIGTDGKLLKSHKLELPDQEAISFLRTGLGPDGKRFYAGSAPGMQQVHVFDQDWKLLLAYPKDAEEHGHAGITDVQVADLGGDGEPELFVSYRGIVGVQGVSITGQRLWSNRSIETVLRLAIEDPSDKSQRRLLAASSRGALAVFDAKGQRDADISVPNRLVLWVVAADLDGDGKPELSGLSPVALGTNVFIGFDRQGKELFSHDLPTGIHNQPVEPITAGNVNAQGPGQWLVVAADGSIRVVTIDGKLLDSFEYGAGIGGLATLKLDGQPALLVSSTNGLEAWRIEPAAK